MKKKKSPQKLENNSLLTPQLLSLPSDNGKSKQIIENMKPGS